MSNSIPKQENFAPPGSPPVPSSTHPSLGSPNPANICANVKETQEEIKVVADTPPILEPHPTRPRRQSAVGRHGLPQEGNHGSWKDHPSHQTYQSQGVNHNDINTTDTTEAFILGDGEKKIEEKIDTRTPNTTIFIYNKEDHTLGNLLCDKLLKNSHVTFAAYRVPHPLFARFELRIQTDGEITPKEALLASSRDIIADLNVLSTNFTREYELRKMVGGAQTGQ